jgi:hypothetical protein
MGRRSSQEWQAIIEQQETSSLSVADFCKQHQLDNKYFHARKRSLLKRQQRKLTQPFIKVGKTRPNSAMILLQLGDAKLSLPVNTEPDWLAQLLKAVAA